MHCSHGVQKLGAQIIASAVDRIKLVCNEVAPTFIQRAGALFNMVFRILLNFTADNTCRPTAPMRRPQSQPRQRLKWRHAAAGFVDTYLSFLSFLEL
jgi:hypothetical protein